MLNKFFRISYDPGKTLLYLWLKNFLKKTKGKLGVDLAGGSMLNKRFFFTKEYICVDINQIKLEQGKIKNQDAQIINLNIKEYLLNIKDKPDIIVCVQTMGTNGFFNHQETLEVIKLMYDVLQKGGSMVFNIGSNGIDINDMEKQLSKFFKNKFEKVDKSFYGIFRSANTPVRWNIKNGVVNKNRQDFKNHKDFFLNIKLSLISQRLINLFSLLFAFMMNYCKPLRTLFGTNKQKLYISCRNKL